MTYLVFSVAEWKNKKFLFQIMVLQSKYNHKELKHNFTKHVQVR